MTPKQAMQHMGCAMSTIRAMIKDGRLKARKVPLPYGGFVYDISPASIKRLNGMKQTVGFPRGRKRK